MPANPKLRRFPRSKIQQDSVKGKSLGDTFYCFQHVLPIPTDEVQHLLLETIDDVKQVEYQIPVLAPVTVEWVGQKGAATSPSKTPCSASEQHAKLAEATRTNLTILHVHGGAFLWVEVYRLANVTDTIHSQGSPEASRSTTSQLAALSGGRVVSVKYRLAPQCPFPAGLLDVVVAYLSLLIPHTDSPHQPINPSTIVFSGDSSGANLLYALLQIIQLTRNHAPITINGHTVDFPLPLPAGLATLSFYADPLNSLPSYSLNRVNDLYLEVPWSLPSYPKCDLWPTSPPRSQIYAATNAYAHPFLTPAIAHDCHGMPPMWFAVGDEQFVDAARTVARRAAQQGVQVDWMQFEAMPHCFPLLLGLDTAWQAKACMQKWAAFCKACVDPKDTDRDRPSARAVKVDFLNGAVREKSIDGDLTQALPLAEVERRIHAMIDKDEDNFQAAQAGKVVSKL
ncbi:MAG: hypothetical protein Q9221_008385 [Calogaya cf. arnoldii]